MFKFLRERKKDNKGFTLVELVIVIAILAILVGLLAPQYTKYVEKTRKAADASNLDEMVKVVKVYAADPANELEAADYTITISATKDTAASIKKGTANLAATDGLYKEMTATIPKWTATNTKSKKWSADGKSADIFAIVTVTPDGGTSVKYGTGASYSKSNKLEEYMSTGETTSTTTTTATGGEN